MVGPAGRVIAVDLQTKMLRHVERKAIRHGVADRVVCHPCSADGIGLTCQADFILAFYMVHETPDARRLFEEILSLLAPGGKLLVVEPKMHVKQAVFQSMVTTAVEAGMQVVEFPSGKGGRAVLLAPAG
jgi:ubiquinone/menaquinone biosynthesis C-methylase UbiE